MRDLADDGPAQVVALRGNHEDAWLKVVDEGWDEFVLPPPNGCLTTMRSFTGGKIPREDAEAIREKAKFSIPEIAEIEKRTNHDVIAFLENVASYAGPASRWIHQGLTSSDILDTTLAVQMNEASAILLDDVAQRHRVDRASGQQHELAGFHVLAGRHDHALDVERLVRT